MEILKKSNFGQPVQKGENPTENGKKGEKMAEQKREQGRKMGSN